MPALPPGPDGEGRENVSAYLFGVRVTGMAALSARPAFLILLLSPNMAVLPPCYVSSLLSAGPAGSARRCQPRRGNIFSG